MSRHRLCFTAGGKSLSYSCPRDHSHISRAAPELGIPESAR